MKRPTDILILTTSFADLDAEDSSAHFLFAPAMCLVEAGFRVHIMMPMRHGQKKLVERSGMRVHRFAFPMMEHAPFYQRRVLYGFRTMKEFTTTLSLFARYIAEIRDYCRAHSIDVIWANWLQIGFLARLATRGRIPLLTTLQGTDVRNFPRPLTRILAHCARDILNMYGKDDEIAGWIREFGFREIRVPNVYLDKRLSTGAHNCILVVGRLENDAFHLAAKGIGERLFRILTDLARERPSLRVIVIGDGSAADRFRGICAGLFEQIRFTGWLDNYDVHLPSARFVIGASGHGGVTLDTLPFGIPVLISRNDPVADFWVDRGNCLVFDPSSEENFRRVIEEALGDDAMLRRIADRARSDFAALAVSTKEAALIWRDAIERFIEASNP